MVRDEEIGRGHTDLRVGAGRFGGADDRVSSSRSPSSRAGTGRRCLRSDPRRVPPRRRKRRRRRSTARGRASRTARDRRLPGSRNRSGSSGRSCVRGRSPGPRRSGVPCGRSVRWLPRRTFRGKGAASCGEIPCAARDRVCVDSTARRSSACCGASGCNAARGSSRGASRLRAAIPSSMRNARGSACITLVGDSARAERWPSGRRRRS